MTGDKPKPTCASCRFFDGGSEQGYCRRHAPVGSIDDARRWSCGAVVCWPIVEAGDWCGEYERK